MTPASKTASTKLPRTRLLAVALALACIAVAFVACSGNRILFAHDVELTGAEITREVAPGGSATLKLHFQVQHPLDADDRIFVHCESISGGVDAVHVNRDADPSVPSTKWGAQEIVHIVQLPF